MPARILMRKVKALTRKSPFVLAWLLPVWVMLGIARATILAIPFRRMSIVLGSAQGNAPFLPLITVAQQRRARQIGAVIRVAARHTPWSSNCFPQAVTARILLGLYGIPYALFFGLTRKPGGDGMDAHAWTAAGPVRITGGESFSVFTVVAVYASPRHRAA